MNAKYDQALEVLESEWASLDGFVWRLSSRKAGVFAEMLRRTQTMNSRYSRTFLVVAWSLLTAGCNRIGDPPRWWYSDHINRSLLCPAPYPTPARQPGAKERRTPAAPIQRTIRGHYAQLRECYNALLRTNREARGKVQVRFTITRDGVVKNQCIDRETTVDDQRLAECILSEFSLMKFTTDEDDYGDTVVVYPFLFAPADG